MKISLKLPLAFAAALALVLAAALFGIYRLNQSLATYSGSVSRSNDSERQVAHLLTGFKVQVQEWKNVLIRGKDPKQLERYWGAFEKQERSIAEGAARLKAELPEGEGKALVEKFAQAHATMGAGYRKGYEAFKAGGFDVAVGDAAVAGIDREPARLLGEAREKVGADSAAAAGQAAAAGRSATHISITLMLLVCAVGGHGI